MTGHATNVFSHVVVGVDGTDFGREALLQVVALAPAESRIVAVTALDTHAAVHAGYLAAELDDQLHQQAQSTRDDAARILVGRANAEARVVRGAVRSVLTRECERESATLLALGGRARSRFLGMLTGETTTMFIHAPALSVLVARPQWGSTWRPGRIVAGIDGSDSSLAALEAASELADRLGSELRVAAATGGKPIRLDAEWTGRVTDWSDERPTTALSALSATADLIVVGSRGTHGLEAVGSVSERIAHTARCSVLLVHRAAR